MNTPLRTSLSAVLLLVGVWALAAEGAEKLPAIGVAIPVDPATDAPFQKASRDGLRDLGYVDGENARLIVRSRQSYRCLVSGLRVIVEATRVDE